MGFFIAAVPVNSGFYRPALMDRGNFPLCISAVSYCHTERTYYHMHTVFEPKPSAAKDPRLSEITGYDQILAQLSALAVSDHAKQAAQRLQPILKESALSRQLADTAQAKEMVEIFGAPPLPAMGKTEEFLTRADAGELLSAEDIEAVGTFLASVGRMERYLARGCDRQISLAFYRENLNPLADVCEEILRCIRNGRVEDTASAALRDARRKCLLLEEKMREKADAVLRSHKSCMAENFTVTRSGRLCVPVRRDCKSKVPGHLVDKSSTGSTLFIEPAAVAGLREEYELCRLEVENEERIILYTLLSMIAAQKEAFLQNIRTLEKLDFAFAKGKLAIDMDAVSPTINTGGYLCLEKARHPALPREQAVPLDFSLGKGKKGMIITGPNTGGKTVTIKTVGLFVQMACSGLFVPCQKADICMCSQVLADVGDGQNITDNLSTFSAHITNIIDILNRVNGDSLVLLDEPGSGTDPAEGMGLAIAICEKLLGSGCLFLVTTHYPEVKTYAEQTAGIQNARMAFDRDNLRPLYRLEMGESGESCALYIAERLGMPKDVLLTAASAAYGKHSGNAIVHKPVRQPAPEKQHTGSSATHTAPSVTRTSPSVTHTGPSATHTGPSIERKKQVCNPSDRIYPYQRGDSVNVQPENVIGIVVNPPDKKGNVLVQIRKQKQLISHKRLRLVVAAAELYPKDYDFSIVFDSVETRKARHQMTRKYEENQQIEVEDY